MTADQRRDYKQSLCILSDKALLTECVLRIRAYHELRHGSPDRNYCYAIAGYCWSECIRREKEEIYREGLEVIRREEVEKRRVNAIPFGGSVNDVGTGERTV